MIFFGIFFFEIILLFFFSRSLTRVLSQFFFTITKNKHITISLLAILFLPGVIIHELSHLLTAAILFVRAGDMEFLPKMQGEEVKLGSVMIGKTDPIRRMIIGISPVIVGTAILAGSFFYLTVINLPLSPTVKLILEAFIVFEVGNTMFSSRKDLEGTIEVTIIFILILTGLFLTGFRLPQSIMDYLSSEMVLDVLKRINILMLVPLVIDLIIITAAKILIRR